MATRRRGSSVVGGIAGLILCAYGIAAGMGYDVLDKISPAWEIGGAAIAFGALLIAWASSEKRNLIGGESLSMIVGVVVALVIISDFVSHRQNERIHPVAALKQPLTKP
jgi:hypothetical protein